MMVGAQGKGFYFVNKTEDSDHLSKSLATEKSAIQRHVQTGLKRNRKSARPGRTLAKDTEVIVPVPKPSRKSTTDDWPPQHPANVGPQPSSASSTDSKHRELQHATRIAAQLETQPCVASPTSQQALSKRDPFDACSVAIDKRVAGLMHYYMFYYHPSQWPNEMILLRKGVYTFQGAVLDIMRNAVADKLAMYCLLAAAACRLQFVDRLPCPMVTGTESQYMHHALRLMTSYIAMANFSDLDQLKHGLISIGFLGSAEAYRGNIEGCQAHFDAQVRLLDAAGGVSFIHDEYVRKHLAMADLFLACVHLKPCLFLPWYDPGAASSLCLTDQELDQSQSIPTATALLEKSGSFISVQMKRLVLELLESYTVKSQIVTSSMSSSRAMQTTHWITMRNMAIRNRLLSLDRVGDREHCLRIAVIMWTLLAMNVTGRAKTVKVMADRLKSTLLVMPSENWMQYDDARLWILLIGYYCADETGDSWIWYMNEVRNTDAHRQLSISASAPAAEVAKALETFQQNYFFDAKTQSRSTRLLAERLSA